LVEHLTVNQVGLGPTPNLRAILPKGKCMIPPPGLYFFHENAKYRYNPAQHGPLVLYPYDTAAYIDGPVI
jgi:hypothetical protein